MDSEANEEVLRRQMNNEQQQSRGDEIKALTFLSEWTSVVKAEVSEKDLQFPLA